jgi:hypothetical protein
MISDGPRPYCRSDLHNILAPNIPTAMSTSNITTTDEFAATAGAAQADSVSIGTTATLESPTADNEACVDSETGQARGTLCQNCGANANWDGQS